MRSLLRNVLFLAIGALGAPLASLSGCQLIEGCPGPIVRDVRPGTYAVDRDVVEMNQIGADTEYALTLSSDGTTVVETFVRDGHAFRNEYAASPSRLFALGTGHDPGED